MDGRVKDVLLISRTRPEITERLWESVLKVDCGITSEGDVQRFMLWLHARDVGGAAGAGMGAYANDQTRRALDVLDAHGLAVSRDVKDRPGARPI